MGVHEIPIEYLRQLISYEPDTGHFLWSARKSSDFVDGKLSASHKCRIWNSNYAGKRFLGALDSGGYRRITILKMPFKAHRVAWAITHGRWPAIIDHINGIRDDNRIKNLRECSLTENMTNRRLSKNNKTGFMGVYFYPPTSKWQAEIKINGVRRHLGYFLTKEDAVSARKHAEISLGFHHNHGRA